MIISFEQRTKKEDIQEAYEILEEIEERIDHISMTMQQTVTKEEKHKKKIHKKKENKTKKITQEMLQIKQLAKEIELKEQKLKNHYK